jgi:hypothetical protein
MTKPSFGTLQDQGRPAPSPKAWLGSSIQGQARRERAAAFEVQLSTVGDAHLDLAVAHPPP